MKLYFVRHGKTEWNLQKRLQGQRGDSPLLPESYEAIARVHAALSSVKFDRVLVSPQARAIKTAQLLTDCPLEVDERLAEWNFGKVEGWLVVDAVAAYPDEMYNSRNDLAHFDGSRIEAEPVNQVLARFDSLATELLTKDYENVLLVGHGASGTAGVRHLAGYPVADLRAAGGLANNTISVLESEGAHFRLIKWNEQVL